MKIALGGSTSLASAATCSLLLPVRADARFKSSFSLQKRNDQEQDTVTYIGKSKIYLYNISFTFIHN